MSLNLKPERSRIYIESFLAKELGNYKPADLDSTRCLNIGCGVTGRYAELLGKFEVDGIDVQPPPENFSAWRYHQTDAQSLLFPDNTFDIALAIESFEHIENNVSAMREAFRVVKPGGKLVLTVPTHWTWLFEFGRHGPHYYTKHSIRALVEGAGFQVESLEPGGGLLFYLANLIKNWASPIGVRLLGPRFWWKVIDGGLTPFYTASLVTDKIFPVLPSNWLMVARKPA